MTPKVKAFVKVFEEKMAMYESSTEKGEDRLRWQTMYFVEFWEETADE